MIFVSFSVLCKHMRGNNPLRMRDLTINFRGFWTLLLKAQCSSSTPSLPFLSLYHICLVFFCFERFIWSEKSLNISVWLWGDSGLPVAVSGQAAGFSNSHFWSVAFGTEFWMTVKIVVFAKHKTNLERRFGSGSYPECVWLVCLRCLQRKQLPKLLFTFPDTESK